MRTILLCCLLFCLLQPGFSQARKVKNADFEVLTGPAFTGTLTYYNSINKTSETVPAKLTVTQSAKEKDTWYFSYEYTDVDGGMDTETLTLLSGGRYINEQEVVECLPGKEYLQVVAEDTRAHTQQVRFYVYEYKIGKNLFSIKVAEKLRGEEKFRPVRTYELRR